MLQERRRHCAAVPRASFPRLLFYAVLAGVLALAAPASPARATVFAVTKPADTNDGACNSDCSLREAIIAANLSAGPDAISLPAGTYTLTIGGTDDAAVLGDLDITGDLTIFGASANAATVDGGGIDRVFEVVGGTVTIANVTIGNGNPGLNSSGGGIANRSGASLTVVNSVIRDNIATFGAGIRSAGALTVTNSLIDHNSATQTGGGIANAGGALTLTGSTVDRNESGGLGGGIYNAGAASVTGSAIISNTATGASTGAGGGVANIGGGASNDVVFAATNSTISGNSAAVDGGGVYNILGTVYLSNATVVSNTAKRDGGGVVRNPDTGRVFLQNTIVAGNTDLGGQAPDCKGTLVSKGYNLIESISNCTLDGTPPDGDNTGNIIGHEPKIGPLRNNGGPTLTHALLATSPALDKGNPGGCTDNLARLLATDQRGFPRPQGEECDIGAYEGTAGGPPSAPPAIAKAFVLATIFVGGISTLVITITNHATVPLSGVAFVDNMPPAIRVSSLPQPTVNGCGGSLGASPGGSTISLSGGSLASGATCTIRVPVTGTTPGSYVNVTGPASATQTGAGTASNVATLNVKTLAQSYLPIVRR